MSNERNLRGKAAEWWLLYDRCGPAVDDAGNRCVAPRLSTIDDKGWKTLIAAYVLFVLILAIPIHTILSIMITPEASKTWPEFALTLYFFALQGVAFLVLRHALHWDALADTFRRPDVAGYFDDDDEDVEEAEPQSEAIGQQAPDYEAHVVDAAGNPA